MPTDEAEQDLRVSIDEQLNTGLWPTVFDTRIPLWKTGQNIRFTEQGVKKVSGRTNPLTANPGSGPIRGLLQNIESDTRILYYGDLTQIYRWQDDGTTTAETRGTGYNLSELAGETTWDSQTTTWDGGGTSWDIGVIKAGEWSFVDFGTFVLATAGSSDKPQIKKGNINFVDLTDGVTGVNIVAGGSGFSVSDPLVFSGGGGTGAAGVVHTIGGGGEITAVKLTASGTGYTSAPTITVTSSGSGETLTAVISNLTRTSIDIFVKKGPHIIGLNTNSSSREFLWSDADDVDDWVPTTINTAGDLLIREFDTPIRAAVPLGDRIAVYGDNQMALINFIGAPFIFGYQMGPTGVGAVSKNAVVEVNRRHYGLSNKGFFETDGVTFRYLDEPAIRKFFLDAASEGQLSQTTAYHSEKDNEVRWYYPSTTNINDNGVSYNYETGAWSILSDGLTATDESSVFPNSISGDNDGNIFLEDLSNNNAGVKIVASIQTKGLDLGEPDKFKEVHSLRLGWTGTQLRVRVAGTEDQDDTPVFGTHQVVVDGYDFLPLRVAGRWIHFEFSSDIESNDWEIVSADIHGRIEGVR